jgi:CheY-like chemotaxis protein
MAGITPKVLIVDDDDMIRTILAKSLSRFTTLTASSAVQGLEMLRKEPVDIVVSDVNMPKMSGLEFLRAMRQDGMPTPFIVITSFTTRDTILEALRSGAFDLIAKPFQPSVISRLLDEANRVNQRFKRLVASRGEGAAQPTPLQAAVHGALALAAPLDGGGVDQKSLEIMSEPEPQKQLVALAAFVLSNARMAVDNLMNFQGRQWDLGLLLRVWYGLRVACQALGWRPMLELATAMEQCYAWYRVRPEDLSTDMAMSLQSVHELFCKELRAAADMGALEAAVKGVETRLAKTISKAG